MLNCKRRMGFAPWVAIFVAVWVAISVGRGGSRVMHVANPLGVETNLSLISLVVIIATGAALVLLAKKCGWSGLLALPVLGALLLFGSLFFGVSSRVSISKTETNGPNGGTNFIQLQRMAADPTLDALWDKLTKSKIDLNGEIDANPMTESSKHSKEKQGELTPLWVTTPPKAVGQVYRESVASDPFVSAEECRHQLASEQLPQAVARRIELLAGGVVGSGVTVADPLSLGIGLDYIFREICRDEFTTTVDSSVGEMKKTYVLLEFNPSVDRYLTDAWLRSERHTRLAHFGKIVGLSLTGLAVAYGLLRFDTWSRGYYSKQLLVGSLLAIIAGVVVYLQT